MRYTCYLNVRSVIQCSVVALYQSSFEISLMCVLQGKFRAHNIEGPNGALLIPDEKWLHRRRCDIMASDMKKMESMRCLLSAFAHTFVRWQHKTSTDRSIHVSNISAEIWPRQFWKIPHIYRVQTSPIASHKFDDCSSDILPLLFRWFYSEKRLVRSVK